MRFHCMTWAAHSWATACLLSFDSHAARKAWIAQSAQTCCPATATGAKKLAQQGYPRALMLWDASEPTKFVRGD